MQMKTASGIKCSVMFADTKKTKLACEFVIDIKDVDVLRVDPMKAKLLGILDVLNALAEQKIANRNLLQAIGAEIDKISPLDCDELNEQYIQNIIELVKSANMP